MPNAATEPFELFINADGGLSCLKDGVLTAVPVGAATARLVIAIWTGGRRPEANCADQYAAQAVQALLEALPNVTSAPVEALTASDDPRVRPWAPTHSEPRPGYYL
jgi:hypothetical protein